MVDNNTAASHSFLLDDDSSIPFSLDDIQNLMDEKVRRHLCPPLPLQCVMPFRLSITCSRPPLISLSVLLSPGVFAGGAGHILLATALLQHLMPCLEICTVLVSVEGVWILQSH